MDSQMIFITTSFSALFFNLMQSCLGQTHLGKKRKCQADDSTYKSGYKPARHIMKTVSVLVISVIGILVSVAPPSFALSTMGRHLIGIIQEVNAQAREAELLQPGKAKPLRFTWDKQTRFVANQHFVDAAILSPGARVEVIFHPHFFGNPYVTKVTLLSTSIRRDSKIN